MQNHHGHRSRHHPNISAETRFLTGDYFGPNSPNYKEKCLKLAQVIDRSEADIVAFVELTSTAKDTMNVIKGLLKNDSIIYQKAILFEAGGGNSENFGVLLSSKFGLEIMMQGCGAKVGGGTRKVGRIDFSRPKWTLYLCHPSPCNFTSKVAIHEGTSIVQCHHGPAIMIGDFNSQEWGGKEATSPDANTFQSQSSGSLKTLDGAVANGQVSVEVVKSERASKDDKASDHAWILFQVSF